MTLQQLKEEARREFDENWDNSFQHLKGSQDEMIWKAKVLKKFESKLHNQIKDFIDSQITKAYEEGKRDKDSEPIEEIPQMKGTLEALDKITPLQSLKDK